MKLPKLKTVLIVGLGLLVLAILLKPSFENNENFDTPKTASKPLKCILFYTEWCGYCKKAKPEWERLRVEMDGKLVGDKQIVVVGVDCDKDEQTAKRYGISGYPTIKFEIDGKVLDYQGENTFNGFKQFIESI